MLIASVNFVRHCPALPKSLACSSICPRSRLLDSAGLGALIGGIRRNRDHDGEIVVVCDKPALTRLLHTTGF